MTMRSAWLSLLLLVACSGGGAAPPANEEVDGGPSASGPGPSDDGGLDDGGSAQDVDGAVQPPLPGAGEPGVITATSTFHSIGIVWRPDVAATPAGAPNVRYRAKNAASWSAAQPLLFTYALPDAVTHARAAEYRGSLLALAPGTDYDIELERAGQLVKAVSATTWSETFPVMTTQKIASQSTPLVITQGGSASGYVVYEAQPGAVIDVANNYDNCVTVKASYVIVRDFTLRGAKKAGVEIIAGATPITDVVVEKNDISGWGRAQSDGFGTDYDAAVGAYQAASVRRLIVQRNVIHAPRYSSNSWFQRRSYLNGSGQPECSSPFSSPGVVDPTWSCHPEGPQAVVAVDPLGSLVVRYNRVFSGNGHRYNDVFGGASNFSFHGFPGPDSDLYGNDISDSWDDGIESEGGNQNVRIWGNRINRTYTGVAVATTSLGPVYVFRNVRGDARISDVDPAGAALTDDASKMAFGPFLKTAPRRYSPSLNALVDENTVQADAVDASGPIRAFHNTIWQPVSTSVASVLIGSGQGISAHQALVRNVWTRNNLFWLKRNTSYIAYPLSPTTGMQVATDTRNDFDYDLSNTSSVPSAPAGAEAHGHFTTTPMFAAGNAAGTFYLAAGAPGADDGVVLPGLNDGFAGAAPDRGAFETGGKALEFGENAYP